MHSKKLARKVKSSTDQSETTDDVWFQHPRFQKYWQQHHKIKEWYCKHMKAQQKVLNNLTNSFPLSLCPQWAMKPLFLPLWNPVCSSRNYSYSEQFNPNYYDSKWMSYRHGTDSRSDMEDQSQYEEEDEDDEYEMEITEDMVAFFQQSQKHREERDAQKASDIEEDYINAEDVGKLKLSNKPPSERPGARRLQEMKFLYGNSAAMIQGMETAMQLSFDRNLDLKQPKFWPNLPLKLNQQAVNDWVIQHFKTALSLEQIEPVDNPNAFSKEDQLNDQDL